MGDDGNFDLLGDFPSSFFCASSFLCTFPLTFTAVSSVFSFSGETVIGNSADVSSFLDPFFSASASVSSVSAFTGISIDAFFLQDLLRYHVR
ncbi:MAG: hypothetical protein ACLUIQ_10650 [Dialister invisus]